jgi:hypothetical protein
VLRSLILRKVKLEASVGSSLMIEVDDTSNLEEGKAKPRATFHHVPFLHVCTLASRAAFFFVCQLATNNQFLFVPSN